jgi:glycosyltransferase involved in cell wall biosynthesis
MKKILFIGDGNCIHNFKWISFFSNQVERYSCFLICENLCHISEKTKLELKNNNIQMLTQINTFSFSNPLRTITSILNLRKVERIIQPDLIHVMFATPHALWLNFIKTPHIITLRGSDILVVIPNLLNQKGIKGILFKFLFSMFKMAFKSSRLVTGTSLAQLDMVDKLFEGSKVELIRTGVEVSKIDKIDQLDLIPNVLLGKEFIFSPRFMAAKYNIELQIDAFSKLNRQIIDRYTFVFIRGKQFDQDYFQVQLQKLENLKEDLNLNFLIFDYLDQSTLWMVLKKASLCIMTPLSDGTPNSALEAMSAKCPLIVSNLNYDLDLFGDSCFKLKTFDQEELTNLVERALMDYPSLLIDNAFKNVSLHGNREIEMGKLDTFYKSF